MYKIRYMRGLALKLANRTEGGPFFSSTARAILARYHRVRVGRYSYGTCLVPGSLPPGTIVGAYCSFASGLRVHRRNHPTQSLSQHPFFYNASVGLLDRDSIPSVEENPLTIGSDVWIGDRVTILAGCRSIGNGAIVGAGAVLTQDVAPYSIVFGVPAKMRKMRYTADLAARIEETRWWELPLSELLDANELLTQVLDIQRFSWSPATQANMEMAGRPH